MLDAFTRGIDGYVVILVDASGTTKLRICPVQTEAMEVAREWVNGGGRAAVVEGKLFIGR